MTVTATTEEARSAGKSGHDGHLAGTGLLSKLVVRRDRVRMAVWTAVIVVLPVATAASYEQLYPTDAERVGLDAQFGATRALGLITGPAQGLDTAGGFVEWRLGATLAAVIGLMAIFHVVRHSRTEEETGRAELLYSTPTGRHAPLASAVGTSIATSVLIGVLVAVTLAGTTGDTTGSVAFAAATSLSGIVFAALAGLTSQLATTSRAALSIASAVLGAAFLLRGVADSADVAWPKWISPIGWAQLVQPFSANDLPVLLLPLALTVVLLAAAVTARNRRDVGAGWITPSPGPATAARRLRSEWALATRIHRPALLGWGIGVLVAGVLFGSLVNAVSDIAGTSPEMTQILERLGGAKGITSAFIGVAAQMLAMIISLYAVSTVLTLRRDETAGRGELLLGTPVTRMRWYGTHVGYAVLGSTVLILVFGAALTIGAQAAGSPVSAGVVLGSALVQLPAILIVLGVAALAIGWAPAQSGVAWAAAGLAIGLALLGPILDLPDAIVQISPFHTVPSVSENGTDWVPIVVQGLVAAGLLAVASVGMRRRDIPA